MIDHGIADRIEALLNQNGTPLINIVLYYDDSTIGYMDGADLRLLIEAYRELEDELDDWIPDEPDHEGLI